ncbi:PEP-CTERM system histidine kinase PrsK [Neiella marina]|uniref:histidine kinase n=1 Tax=Neiella holothuriorum TaxID=2870530 RepID=A0ABS7EHF0_9GAMM|nr:XrtA/PEP-CTERM system histidine kinase PrsK [Neiella holothuriorum]MBW8191654.1 PEP-CTERM system histidine kinase PrsK [Neiella holothuriorum]
MTQVVGVWGYGLAGAAFLFLFLLILTTQQRSLPRSCLLIATAITAVWGVIAAAQQYVGFGMPLVQSLNSVRNGAWLMLLAAALADTNQWRGLFLSPSRLAISALILLTAVGELIHPQIARLTNKHLLILHLAQPVVALWLLEQLYRQTLPEKRWAIKTMCLGLAMVYVFDFVFFSNAVLTSVITIEFWNVRGWLFTAAAPLILLTARRAPDWSTRVFVSREVIFHSTLLLVAGSYLLLMSLAGYYIRYMGGNWGGIAQILFFALGGLLLAALFLSDGLRRRVKVLIAKHFFANKYEYRDEWMRFAEVFEDNLSSPHKIALQALVKPFGSESALLAIKTPSGYETVAQVGKHDESEAVFMLSKLAGHVIEHDWVLDAQEIAMPEAKLPFEIALEDRRPLSCYQLIIPIGAGSELNAVCLLSMPKNADSFNWEDRDLMRVIARQLSVHLKLHQANQALSESQQFDTFNRMSAFLVHDLKNILAQLQLLTRNAEKHKHNPEFVDDAFETVAAASTRLNKVLTQLRQKRAEGEQDRRFDLAASILQVVTTRSASFPVPTFDTQVTNIQFKANQDRFENVLSHLIQNAQDATGNNGSVTVSLKQTEQQAIVRIRDTGQGMTKEFINNRLFKPFDTTKGNAGMGIGAYDAKKFVEQLGGQLIVTSEVDHGSEFAMVLPIQA